MLSTELIDRVLRHLPSARILLFGDLFVDRYLDLDDALTEKSIETGLDAYQVVQVRSYPGALGTVINNLAALGVGTIRPITVIGDDGEGHELRQALRQLPAVDPTHLVNYPGRRTPTYTKPMLAKSGRPAVELNRLDIKNRLPTPGPAIDDVLGRLESAWNDCDAVLVLDQVSEVDCGVVTARARARIAELAERDPEKFVLADSREQIDQFRNVSIKPNERESQAFTGGPSAMARRNHRPVFATHGEQGMELSFPNGAVHRVPGYPVRGPIDIVGAGDSASAGIACAIAAGLDHVSAAAFGNLIASITVQQIGVTGTATPEQVRDRWREVASNSLPASI